jgi:uncharacterized membrane protein
MDKMLVTIFNEPNKAYEACPALKQMHDEGCITIYSLALVFQNRQGKISFRDVSDGRSLGLNATPATCGLVRLLGAPLRIAAKASAGTLSDLLNDYQNVGVSIDFLDQVSKHMAPGKTAVVAEVDEDWALAVDTKMEALGGVVLRRARAEVEDLQLERDISMLKADIAGLKAAAAYASRDTRAQIEARIHVVQSELQALQVRASAKSIDLRREADFKIKSVMGQASALAQGTIRARLEKRIADLRAEYESLDARLSKVERLAESALV